MRHTRTRIALFSALAAAVTVALLFALARRLSTSATGKSNPWAGLAAATVFGLGPIWWAQATVAEVYTLHGLFVVAILAVAIQIGLSGVRVRSAYGVMRNSLPLAPCALPPVTLLCLLIGLALAHHRTTLLLVPALLIYLLWSVPGLRRPQRVWAVWLVALLAPLLLYLWIPLRAAQGVSDLHGSYVNTWSGFWAHVLARGYSGFFAENALMMQRSASDWLTIWQRQVGVAGLLLGGVGLIGIWPADRGHRPWQTRRRSRSGRAQS